MEMLKEVHTAIFFLKEILARNSLIADDKIDKFCSVLERLLYQKFEKHWHPQKPFLGSAFRCIRITQIYMDPDFDKAASLSGLTIKDLLLTLPQEFTMWIDPDDVSYRIGEEGSICSLTLTVDLDLDENNDSFNQTCRSEVTKPVLKSSNSSSYTQCWT